MPAADITLDTLRREIDTIDDAMHDLLMRRAALSEQIRAAKGDGGAAVFRPGREARILRRLVGRHQGSLPPQVVVLVWREIISAMTRLQAPFTIALYAPRKAPRVIELAQAHFGSLTPLLPMGSIGLVLSAVTDGKAQLGLLPLPEEDETPWWRGLGNGPDALYILARLPFASVSTERSAVVVGRQAFEPSGEDRGYVIVETDREFSRARLSKALEAAGFQAVGFPAEATESSGNAGGNLYLVEMDAYVAPDDPRFGPFVTKAGLGFTRIRSIGGYAVPISIPAARKQT